MKKEFVPYEQALELKELGFDELCICIYNREKSLRVNVFNNPNDRFKSVQLSYNNGKIPAPLYQQAFRWFREKHQMHHQIIIRDLDKYKEGNPDFQLMIYTNTPVTLHKLKNCKAYEEAELECLKQLIKIVKKKNNG